MGVGLLMCAFASILHTIPHNKTSAGICFICAALNMTQSHNKTQQLINYNGWVFSSKIKLVFSFLQCLNLSVDLPQWFLWTSAQMGISLVVGAGLSGESPPAGQKGGAGGGGTSEAVELFCCCCCCCCTARNKSGLACLFSLLGLSGTEYTGSYRTERDYIGVIWHRVHRILGINTMNGLTLYLFGCARQ